MLRLKTFSVIIHIACWLLFMAFPLLFINGRDGNTSMLTIIASPHYWAFCTTYIVLFYVNAYILFPKFFLKKKYIGYAIICLCLLSAIYFLKPYERLLRGADTNRYNAAMQQQGGPQFGLPPNINRQGPPSDSARRGNLQFAPGVNQPPQFGQPRWANRRRHFDSSSLFLFLMILALSTAIKTVQQWQVTEQRVISAEAEKASAELSFLKAQINPHFLFNTLNNIYTLAITNNENTAESIMKLSNIMRYVTDDVMLNYVTLQSEVDCIEDYIALQGLRIGGKTKVNFNIDGTIAQQKIAPLLLMTFVENVFKYGVSKQHESVIDINLLIAADTFTFMCTNQIFERKEHIERTGIGITNTKQRLQHIYPGKHTLNITDDNNQFTVVLTLHT
ncbi:histidine kinase [Mucilaginibacter sp. RB4R14]|uniref:sensor histidine kinase n=1 Tax=Mucilaginibacter aurantiaciroseus TaxID=2949308 RepID=UPI002090BD49|nr:sensor histidine kinase [Mucilaginibacter aurantiaciroseus]MCO5937243.1 histidine kinase [Mucilaginibacter aurantiaciroseus]